MTICMHTYIYMYIYICVYIYTCAMIHCAMMHVRIHARMHVYMRVYMSNPFAHAHNAHACRMLADYQQRSAYARAASVRATAWGGHTRKDGVRLASSRARNAKKSAASSGVIRPATSSRFHFPSLPFPVAPFHNYIMFVNILL